MLELTSPRPILPSSSVNSKMKPCLRKSVSLLQPEAEVGGTVRLILRQQRLRSESMIKNTMSERATKLLKLEDLPIQ